ncbi:Tim44 domain-containing protein [Caenimonas sedimenti]|uniref:Tim44 domain-containing protein n=1 Tax=Caenimonas sedimenti TaxID=2596921 RepID=UPI0021021F71|nr:TIM44-like domain-containing protein [Caenimonas sedimenti]
MLALGAPDAQAARLGGGPAGQQSTSAAPRQNTAPASPATATPDQQKQALPAAASTAPSAGRPGAGMLGGLAAGLGLAWLAHTLGLGAAFGQFLLFALLALVIMAGIGLFVRARSGPAAAWHGDAYQGAGAPANTVTARQYSPDKVGNDASARPWERSSMAFEVSKIGQQEPQGSGARTGPALESGQTGGMPAGFDAAGFLAAAKRNFITLQDAWDRSDTASLRSMMTDEMLGEIRQQLAERDGQPQGAPSHTDIVLLEAQLLGVEDQGGFHLASVEFSGMIREDPSAGPSPFREVWNMTRPKDGAAGWLVAGVLALQ